MKEQQPHYKPNELRHMDNQSHLMDFTLYHGERYIHGQVQKPLTPEQRKIRKLRKK